MVPPQHLPRYRKSYGSPSRAIAVQMCFPCSFTPFGHGGGHKDPMETFVILGASIS
ncbi:hypothetical protein CC86DRAFT_288407 [Ophiobolus disseminans]|uniref:Uncharacterized protein n=1 Tax=Ophiobolus disseminans TaxID=1469910 RepID=A0A6A7A556_9PLEO|nr:hypothetical protein CC86DRAFT_288407 [Ophiobolus disseminans]